MDDAFLVRVFQGPGELQENLFGFRWGDWALCNAAGEGRPGHQLHYESAAIFDSVNGRDPWMIELDQNPGFPLKARQTLGITGERHRQNLDGILAFELRIQRPLDFPYAAAANQGVNPVRAEGFTRGQAHAALLESSYFRQVQLLRQSRLSTRLVEHSFAWTDKHASRANRREDLNGPNRVPGPRSIGASIIIVSCGALRIFELVLGLAPD